MNMFRNPIKGVPIVSLLLAYQMVGGITVATAADSLFAPEAPAIASTQVDHVPGNTSESGSSTTAKETEAQIGASAAVTTNQAAGSNTVSDIASLLRAPGAAATHSASPSSVDTNAVSAPSGTNTAAVATTTNAPAVAGTNGVAVAASAPETKNATDKSPAIKPAPKKELPMIPVDEPPNLKETPDKMAASAPPPVAPSENVTLNLINRLVQRGILTKEDAGDLIRQAKNDAQIAAQQAQVTAQASQQAAAAQQMAIEASAPPTADESVSVSYVPDIVKTEMKDEIKRDVMAAAQTEGWANPNIPSWINNFRPFMDFRFRYQDNTYPDNTTYNNETVPFDLVNFNAVNTGNPLNMAQIPGVGGAYGMPGLYPNSIYAIPNNYYKGTANGNGPTGYFTGQSPAINPPTYNNTQQRQYERIRFRFGADMNLGDNFTSGFRIGTGQNGNPVSENQTLGAPGTSGQGGNFSSYAIWIDRAFLKYELGSDPDRMAAITFGRFDNPFYTPTTMMWANDIGFDGIAAQMRYKVHSGITPFATVGLFPIYNTDLNFSSTQQPKQGSYDKYLYAAQIGLDWKVTKDINFKGAAGYYYFQNAQGQVSAPMVTPVPGTVGSTDDSRPTFAQVGNSYMELRDIKAVNEYPSSNPIPNSQQVPGSYIPTPKTNTTTANVIYNPDYQNYVNTGANMAWLHPLHPTIRTATATCHHRRSRTSTSISVWPPPSPSSRPTGDSSTGTSSPSWFRFRESSIATSPGMLRISTTAGPRRMQPIITIRV